MNPVRSIMRNHFTCDTVRFNTSNGVKVVGIETSGIIGGVALCHAMPHGYRDSPRDVLKEYRFKKGLVHGKYLVPALQKGLKALRWKITDPPDRKPVWAGINLVAVDIGPGSYTGLRVGLAVAKTLAYSLKCHLVGVTSLDAMTENIPPRLTGESFGQVKSTYEFVCPLIDAKWKQVYTALYQKTKKGSHRRISDYQAITPEEWARKLPNGTLIFGDGLKTYKDLFTRKGLILGLDERWWYPRPGVIARAGFSDYENGQRADPFKLVPLYLRPTEAELKKKTPFRKSSIINLSSQGFSIL